jgi:hypothetical protein
MKIKETIYTETDARGRIIKRTRTIEEYPDDIDRGYDYGTRYGGFGRCHEGSLNRIFAAYDDYRKTQQW